VNVLKIRGSTKGSFKKRRGQFCNCPPLQVINPESEIKGQRSIKIKTNKSENLNKTDEKIKRIED
jgi:hypothetical protein